MILAHKYSLKKKGKKSQSHLKSAVAPYLREENKYPR